MVEDKKKENEELKTAKPEPSENNGQEEKKEETKPTETSEEEKTKEAKEEIEEKKTDTEKPDEKTSSEPPKKKKVNQMTLSEIEAQLKIVQENMGGFQSKYAQHLLKRKNNLTSIK